MSPDPITIDPGATVLSALDQMVDEGVRHLLVVDARGQLVGVLSIDDLAAVVPVPVSLHRRLEGRDRRDLSAMKVGEVMSYGPDTVMPDTSADEAARRMALKGFGCLPVVDAQGRVEGILSETDLLEAFAAQSAGSEIDRAAFARSRDERLVETLRGEAERLAQSLPLYDQVGPSLAVERLKSLEEAIVRAERGELHSCSRCKGRISGSRLRVLPSTTLCSRCARELEW